MNRTTLELLLVALVTLGGVGWCHARDEELRAEGRLEMELERADSLRDAVELQRQDAELARAEADTAAARAAREIAASEAQVAAALAAAARARSSRADLVDRLAEHAGADSALVRATADSVAAAYEPELAAERSARVGLERTIAAQRQELATVRPLVVELEGEIAALRSLNASLEAINAVRSRSSWTDNKLVQAGAAVLIFGAGYAAGS